MSAGGLSYSGLTNYGRATLPSVETWGTNMNILQDPPTSIHTRRIDKVGQTSDITTMIDDSSNRACEAINVYARGVNPMVSVSYSNNGSNGGGLNGQLPGLSNIGAAKNPYTIMDGGAFRPPLPFQKDLMPLSRQPRVWTEAMTKPGFIDFSKKAREVASACKTREVKNEIIQGEVEPTLYYKYDNGGNMYSKKKVEDYIKEIETKNVTAVHSLPDSKMQENKKVKFNINKVSTSAGTNKENKNNYINNVNKHTESFITDAYNIERGTNVSGKNMDRLTEMTGENYIQEPLKAEAETMYVAIGDYMKNNEVETDRYLQNVTAIDVVSTQKGIGDYTINTEMDSGRFIQDHLNTYAMSKVSKPGRQTEENTTKSVSSYLQSKNLTEATSNKTSNCNNTRIDEVIDFTTMPVKEISIIEAESGKLGQGPENRIYSKIELEKNLPHYNAITNKTTGRISKNTKPEVIRELTKKLTNGEERINMSKIGNTEVSSRERNLVDKPIIGSFESKPTRMTGTKMVTENNVKQNNGKMELQKKMGDYNRRFGGGRPR